MQVLSEQLKNLKYSNSVIGYIGKLNQTTDEIQEETNHDVMDEEWIRKELMTEVDFSLTLDKKLVAYSLVLKNIENIKSSLKDKEMQKMCLGKELTAKHGITIIQLLVPYINYIAQYSEKSPLLICHYYKVLAQGWTTSRFFSKDDIFTGLILNLKDSLLPRLNEITGIIYQKPKSSLVIVNSCLEALKAYKAEYLKNREEIEKNGKIIRWEFDQTKLFDSTNYISDVLSDLDHILTVLLKIQSSLDDDMKTYTGEAISIDELLKKSFKIVSAFEQLNFDIWDKKNKNTWKMMLRRFDDNLVHIGEMICQFITNCLRKTNSSFANLQILQCCTKPDTLESVAKLADDNLKVLVTHFFDEICLAKAKFDAIALENKTKITFRQVYDLKQEYNTYKKVMVELRKNRVIDSIEGKSLFDRYISFSVVIKHLHDTWCISFFDNTIKDFNKYLSWNVLKESNNKLIVNFPFDIYNMIKEIKLFETYITDLPVNIKIIAPQIFQCSIKFQRLFRTVNKLNSIRSAIEFTEEWLISDQIKQLETVLNTGILRMTWSSLAIDKYCDSLEMEILSINNKVQQARKTLHMINKKIASMKKVPYHLITDLSFENATEMQTKLKVVGRQVAESVLQIQSEIAPILSNLPKVFHKNKSDPLFAQLCLETEKNMFYTFEAVCDKIFGLLKKKLKNTNVLLADILVSLKGSIFTNPSPSQIYKILMQFPNALLNAMDRVTRWKNGTCEVVKKDMAELYNFKTALGNSRIFNKAVSKYQKVCQDLSKTINTDIEALNKYQMIWKYDLDHIQALELSLVDSCSFYANLTSYVFSLHSELENYSKSYTFRFFKYDFDKFLAATKVIISQNLTQTGTFFLTKSINEVKDNFSKIESLGELEFGSLDISVDFKSFFKIKQKGEIEEYLASLIYHFDVLISLCRPLFNTNAQDMHLGNFRAVLETKRMKTSELMPMQSLFDLLRSKLEKEFLKNNSYGDAVMSKYLSALQNNNNPFIAVKTYAAFNKEFKSLLDKALEYAELGRKSNLNLEIKWTDDSCQIFPSDDLEMFLNEYVRYHDSTINFICKNINHLVVSHCEALIAKCELLVKFRNFSFLDTAKKQLEHMLLYLQLFQSLASFDLEQRHFVKISKTIKTSDVQALDLAGIMRIDFSTIQDAIITEKEWLGKELDLQKKYLCLLKTVSNIFIHKSSSLLFKSIITNISDMKLEYESIIVELALLLSLDQSEFVRMEIIATNDELVRVADCLSNIEDVQTEIESVYMIIQNLLKNNSSLDYVKALQNRYYKLITPLVEYESIYTLVMSNTKDLSTLKKEVFTLKRQVFTELDQFRNKFPRFWILSNDELIKVLSFSFKKEWFNTFKRIFNGVDKFTFNTDAGNVFITSLGNTEGESLILPVDIGLNYSDLKCFASLLNSMNIGMHRQILQGINCILENDFDGLILLTCSAITVALRYCSTTNHLKSLSEKIIKELQRTNKLKSKKLEKIFIDLSNAKELSNIFGVEITDNIIYTTFKGMKLEHGLEFKACSRIFCHTPITSKTFCNYYIDRISKKWTYALGLSGSGKTESIQEFSDFCGYFCYEVNCGDVMGSDSLKNILAGSEFNKASYWINLSEVNRLSSKVLLQLSESILTLNGNTNSNVFVSLNPYSQSRNVIPESVKFQFHQIMLEKPPVKEIFVKMLASPIFLTKDKRFAESLLQRACYLDCFHTRDTYPGIFLKLLQMYVENPNQIMPSMKSFVHLDKGKFMYRNDTDTISKIESIVQFLERFHSLVLVGSFDDSFIKTIKDIEGYYLSKGSVKVQVINPNMHSSSENFGNLDDFNVFTSGVITSCLEEGCSFNGTYLLILNAELFSEWSENINSVLDDNRSFFYPDGKKLEISTNVKIIFCTCSLKMVSPSVTRRSTVVFVDEDNDNMEFWSVHFDKLKTNHLLSDPDISVNAIVNFYSKIKHLNALNCEYYAFWTYSTFKTFEECSQYFDVDLTEEFQIIQSRIQCDVVYDPNAVHFSQEETIYKTTPETNCQSILTFIKLFLVSVSKENWQTQKVRGQTIVFTDIDHSVDISTFSFLRFYLTYKSLWINNESEWIRKNISKLTIKATVSDLNIVDPELRRLLRSIVFLKLPFQAEVKPNSYFYGNIDNSAKYNKYSSFETYISEPNCQFIYVDIVKEKELINLHQKEFFSLITRNRYPQVMSTIEECVLYGKSIDDLGIIRKISKHCDNFISKIELKVDVKSYVGFIQGFVDISCLKLDDNSTNLKHIEPVFHLLQKCVKEKLLKEQKTDQLLLVKLNNSLLNIREREVWLHGRQKQAFLESQNLTTLRIDVGQKTKFIDDKKKIANLKEREISESKQKIETEKGYLDIALKLSYPVLESAKKALSNISASDITELRSFSKPPMDVQKVVECICILLKKEDLSWKSAKSMMSNTEFRNNLMSLDCDTLTHHQIHHIEKILKSSELSTEKMKRTSSAGFALLDYVFNILQYHEIITEMKPKMKLLQVFDSQLDELINSKEVVLLEIGELEQDILELKQHLNALEKSLLVVDKNIVIWKDLDQRLEEIEVILLSVIRRTEIKLKDSNSSLSNLDIQCFNDSLYFLGLGENCANRPLSFALPFVNTGLQLHNDLVKLFYYIQCRYPFILLDTHLKCNCILSSIPNTLVVQIIDPKLMQKLKFSLENNKNVIIVSPNLSSVPQDILLMEQPITIYCSHVDVPVLNFAVVTFDSSEFTTAADKTWQLEYQKYLETSKTFSNCDSALISTLHVFQSTKEEENIEELLDVMNHYEKTFAILNGEENNLLKFKFTTLFDDENKSLVRYHSQVPGIYAIASDLMNNVFYQIPIEGILKFSLLPADQLLFYTNQTLDIYPVLKHVVSCGIVFIFSQGDSSFQLAKEVYPELKRCSIKNVTKEMAIYYNMLNLPDSELLQLYFKLQQDKSFQIIIDVPLNELQGCSVIVNQILKLGYKISSLVSLDLRKVISKNLEMDLPMPHKNEFLVFHSVVCFLIEMKLIMLYPQYWIDNLISIIAECSGDLREILDTFYLTNLRHLNEKITCGHMFDYIKYHVEFQTLDAAIDMICNDFQESDKFKFDEPNSDVLSKGMAINEFNKLQLLEDLSPDERKYWISTNLIELNHLSIPSNLVFFFDQDLMYIDGIPVLNLSKSDGEGCIALSGIQMKNAWLTSDGLLYAQSRLSQSGFISKCSKFEYLVPLFKDNVLYLYFNCSVADELLNIKIVRIDV